MRVLGTIPNKVFNITVFSWNERYIAKFEAGTFEQLYKFPHGLFSDWQDLEKLFDETFIEQVRSRFKQMVKDSEDAYKRYSENPQNKNAP